MATHELSTNPFPPPNNSMKELTVSGDSDGKSKNYLGILLSILVLIVISSVIVAAIVIINPEIANLPTKPQTMREAVSLEDALLGEMYPSDFTFQWAKLPSSSGPEKHDELLFEDLKNIQSIHLPAPSSFKRAQTISAPGSNTTSFSGEANNNTVSPPFNISTLIANSSLLASIEYQGFKISPSKRFLLLWTNKVKQFRHSYTAKYFIYDIKFDLISLLSTQSTATATSSSQAAFEHLDSATEYLNELNDGNEFNRFQHAEWFSLEASKVDPASAIDELDSLILIQNNDLFMLESVALIKRSRAPIRLTFTGKSDEIFNGIPDWLYEEEILADVPAYQVSPSASSLAYLSFNDSLVDRMPFTIYGSMSTIIPKTQKIRYSKAGRPNPHVTVHVIDLKTKQDLSVQLPEELATRQHYIFRLKWLTNEKLFLSWLNRHQNESYFLVCSDTRQQSGWLCEKNLFQTSGQEGWLDMSDEILPLDENHYLSLMYREETADVGKFKHVAKIAINGYNQHQFLTKGQREVINLDGVNRARSILYYTSTIENEPGQRQLFALDFSNAEQPVDSCITCSFYPNECLYNYAKMSPTTNYYIFECHGPGIPRYELRKVLVADDKQAELNPKGPLSGQQLLKASLNQGDRNSLLWTIEENVALREKISNFKAMPLTMRLKVPIPNTNYKANVLMLLPPQLGYTTTFKMPNYQQPRQQPVASTQRAPSLSTKSSSNQNRLRLPRGTLSNHKFGLVEQEVHQHFTPETISLYTNQLNFNQQYPMVVDVYGGPSSQKVDNRFAIGFGHYMASSKRTVYVMIDGRGSGYQGTKRLYELYHKFGSVEIQDQIEVAAYLTRNYSFIDPSKVAIWGWSYGGYAAAMALAQSNRLPMPTTPITNSSGPINRVAAVQKAASNGVFECAVSVAPVTNWIYYDTAYTERYMSSPYVNEKYDNYKPGDHLESFSQTNQFGQQMNNNYFNQQQQLVYQSSVNEWTRLNQTRELTSQQLFLNSLVHLNKQQSPARNMSPNDLNERYKSASLIDNIHSIDKKRFLLIHGTADDNVHFQQSMMLMKRLIHKNILFESRLYPDQDHSIGNKADKLHLGSTLSNFFSECFDMVY